MPVLVHCSHGWDRTAQVTAFAQLLLDPFYRTFDGFKVLIEKEWCSFGHPFQLRCAHGQDKASRQDDQTSPVFLQFLDCVWQLMHQYPHYFEYNSRYLITLADHIYSCRFGTFLFNSDYERDSCNARQRTLDIWTYLHYNRGALTNPLYLNPNLEHTPTTSVLLPPLTQLLRNVTLWTDYYFRWTTLPSMVSIPDTYSRYLYDNGLTLQHNVVPVKSFDMELPAIATCDDFWESAYRKASREASGNNQVAPVLNGNTDDMSSVEKDDLIKKQQRIITRLLSVVHDNGIPFDDSSFIQSFDVSSSVGDTNGSGTGASHAPALFEI